MPDIFRRLGQGFAPNIAAAIYTVPANIQGIVRHIRVVNTDTVPRTVTLYNGGNAAVNQISGTTMLQPQETLELDCFLSMAANDTVQAVASQGGVVTVSVYGMEIQ